MVNQQLIRQIECLTTKRQICLIGAAVIDLVMQTPFIPSSGGEVLLSQQEKHIGGCAFNIALMLKQLGMQSYNALPIGTGIWATQISQLMQHYQIVSEFTHLEEDNGWCLALVDPTGERTFFTIEGIESTWNKQLLANLHIEKNAIIYLCGYQLSSKTGSEILDWLESLSQPFDLFIDFGPRISTLNSEIFNRVFALKPIISVNRQEAEFLGLDSQSSNFKDAVQNFAHNWFTQHHTPIIIRLDCEGAYVYQKGEQKWVDIFPVTVIDTIGAGDNHAGGVLAALSAGWSLSDAVTLGNAVASYTVGQKGADYSPTRQQLIKHIKQE